MNEVDKKAVDNLKIFAAKNCVDIFEMFDEMEIQEQLAPIRSAWHTGREIRAIDSKQKDNPGRLI